MKILNGAGLAAVALALTATSWAWDPDEAAERVYNFLHTLTIEAQLFARACGKTHLHSLEPEDLAALTMEASAMAGVPLAGTNHTVGIEDYHHL